jgi:hypothetical protein
MTYRSNNGEWGWEAFHTFCQTLKELSWDGIPRRSIFMSPLVSMGMGCESEDGGTESGLLKSEMNGESS